VTPQTDRLWGGTLTSVQLDPVRHECQLHVDLLEDGANSTHVLRCRGVTEFHFFNEIPEPWSYAEVTEVHADYDSAAHCWRLETVLWSESAGIVLRCVDFEVRTDTTP